MWARGVVGACGCCTLRHNMGGGVVWAVRYFFARKYAPFAGGACPLVGAAINGAHISGNFGLRSNYLGRRSCPGGLVTGRLGWLTMASGCRFCVWSPLVQRDRWRWLGSLSARGKRAATGLQRALSEAGEDTVLARPGARLSGRARGVVLVAGDEAKRQSGSPVPARHLSMPSLNSTPRVRPVRSPGCIGRARSAGAGRFILGDVPVPCRRSHSPPRLLGGSFWAFPVDFGRAQHHLRGRGVFWGGTRGLGRVVENK